MPSAKEKYADIIDHPHFVSPDFPQMSRLNRAAQFSPFAALTGYGDLIDEAARYTGEKTEPDESKKQELDRKLSFLLAQAAPPAVTVTYFLADGRKEGGEYRSLSDKIVGFDRMKNTVLMASGLAVPISDVADITGDCFFVRRRVCMTPPRGKECLQ